MKTKKIIKALKIIRNECNKHYDCNSCIFSSDDDLDECPFYRDPDKWDIKGVSNKLKDKERI